MAPAWVMAAVMVGAVDEPVSALPSPNQAWARPKSRIFTSPSAVCMMLAGLRSRWTMPASWAASSPAATCRAITRASSTGIGPSFMRSVNSAPTMSSITRKRTPSVSSKP